jgi:hypothetical protein
MSNRVNGKMRRSRGDSPRRKSTTLGEDCLAALASAALIVVASVLMAQPASSNDGELPESPLAIEWNHDLWFDGESARLLARDGAIRPFLSAGGGLGRWGIVPERLGLSSHARDEVLTSVGGGLSIRIAPPVVLNLSGGWVHDASQLHLGNAEDGFGAAGARLKIRF